MKTIIIMLMTMALNYSTVKIKQSPFIELG